MSRKVIQTKAETIGSKLYYSSTASLSVVVAAASLSKHGYLTRVGAMNLRNINLASVPHAACLGDIQVDGWVGIDNVQGDIGSIVGKIRLGYDGSVEVDMETLASYDGRGRCRDVQCCYKTGDRYRDQVRRWAGRIGWKVWRDNSVGIGIERR